jgi:hypothetical protein
MQKFIAGCIGQNVSGELSARLTASFQSNMATFYLNWWPIVKSSYSYYYYHFFFPLHYDNVKNSIN